MVAFTDADPSPQISVAVGVIVGLLASFVQSLGLTIQRKSHLQNEELPNPLRIKDYKRPLWIVGFTIFICSNLLGTIFQIGALPIVVLGPLGAVSLLYNAFFAKVILGDEFSVYLIAGTFLIAGGAVLIGIFGVVPEQTHTLDELVALYSRPAFIIWISLLSFSLLVLIVVAHLTEWAFERKLHKSSVHLSPSPDGTVRRRASSLWQTRRPSALHTQSAPIPQYGAFEDILPRTTRGLVQLETRSGKRSPDGSPDMDRKAPMSAAAVERTRVILGVAYGSASGTLSGLCLLFAKTGIELLILTVVGQNQFNRYQAWLIVLVLLFAAVLQLIYLNRALRLVGPTLICPLAFCFYNLSSMISGLIYYDQWDLLSSLQIGLVGLGTAILLSGVWIVSIKDEKEARKDKILSRNPSYAAGITDEPESDGSGDGDVSDREQENVVDWLPRGLTIGLGAASPGFEVRPAGHRRYVRGATLPSYTSIIEPGEVETPLLHQRTASETDTQSAAEELARRRKARQRGYSISGALYVGHASGPSHAHGQHRVLGRNLGGTESTPSTPFPDTESDEGEGGVTQGSVTPRKRWRSRAL